MPVTVKEDLVRLFDRRKQWNWNMSAHEHREGPIENVLEDLSMGDETMEAGPFEQPDTGLPSASTLTGTNKKSAKTVAAQAGDHKPVSKTSASSTKESDDVQAAEDPASTKTT